MQTWLRLVGHVAGSWAGTILYLPRAILRFARSDAVCWIPVPPDRVCVLMPAVGLLVALVLAAAARTTCEALTILPLGDSITFGCGDSCPGRSYDCTTNETLDCPDPLGPSTCQGGYRTRLWQLLSDSGVDATFVGPLTTGPSTAPARARGHAGFSGAAIGPSSSKYVRVCMGKSRRGVVV